MAIKTVEIKAAREARSRRRTANASTATPRYGAIENSIHPATSIALSGVSFLSVVAAIGCWMEICSIIVGFPMMDSTSVWGMPIWTGYHFRRRLRFGHKIHGVVFATREGAIRFFTDHDGENSFQCVIELVVCHAL
jgi:hypothetical protein